MLLQGVKLIRVEYEVDEKVYKITVAAKGLDTVLQFLQSKLQKPIKVNTVEDLGLLKLITPEVIDVILQAKGVGKVQLPQPEVRERLKPGPKPKKKE